jgi:F0F1-type ATP synthase membrane subunit b/b'
VDNAERVAKAIVIERIDSYLQRTEAIAARVQQQVNSASENIRSEFKNIVGSAAHQALRDLLENEVAALVLKLLVEYQVADIAGDPIKN